MGNWVGRGGTSQRLSLAPIDSDLGNWPLGGEGLDLGESRQAGNQFEVLSK